MIEAEITTFLNANGVTAFYYEADKDAALPFCVIDRGGSDTMHRIDNTKRYTDSFDLAVYGAHAEQAITLANTLIGVLDDYKGAMGAYTITLARITNEYDADEPQSASFSRNLSLTINYRV